MNQRDTFQLPRRPSLLRRFAACLMLCVAISTGCAVPDGRILDIDGDGVPDEQDAFPTDPSEDSDRDGDGVGDNRDAFPDDRTESVDTDGDGIGNNTDSDDDNDGVLDENDIDPINPDVS